MTGGREHWTNKAGVKLFLWEKSAGVSAAPLGTILFVHGSSMASQPTFDLHVPGRPDSSAMDLFAGAATTRWCVDMEGYGRSDKSRPINADIANGADDLEAATDYIQRASGATRSWSTASRRARCGPRCSPSGTRIGCAAGARRVRVDRARAARRWRSGEAPAGVPGEEPAPDRPRLRAQHLHARSSRHGRRRHGRGVRGRDPGAGRLGADRHLCRHVREPAAGRSARSPCRRIDHARRVRRHRGASTISSRSSRGCRIRTSSSL